MSFNAGIIDQRLDGIQSEIKQMAADELGIQDEGRLKSLSFVYLCVKTILDLNLEEAFDCLTEGSGDFGVDAIQITEEIDGEFGVTLFQSKYKTNLDGEANFPENGIDALIKAIRYIFDPFAELGSINERLQIKVEQARSMIRDGYLPRVRAIACNNGLKWRESGDDAISRTGFGNQVTWEHVNHDALVSIMQKIKPVNATLRLLGKAIVEDMNFSRVCIGRMPVTEISALMKEHGEKLLERNIRRYLGLHGNRVNEGIKNTLNSDQPGNFYFFNNGITLVCNDFNYNALQSSDFQVKVENLQIVNGGQTCMTIYKTLEDMEQLPSEATVLVRIYKLPKENEDIMLQITHATNSQNPVDLKDLRSNDVTQVRLETSIRELNYTYKRKRTENININQNELTSGTAAEAILAIWRQKPHQAKFLTREHFGKLYDTIFSSALNGAQTVVAVLLYRIAENHRRRLAGAQPQFVRYASCFIAMQMGRHLLKYLDLTLKDFDHRHFEKAKSYIESQGEVAFTAAVDNVQTALEALYGEQEQSMQQLSATFRRGDLIEKLLSIKI
jgi:AIPR protein